MADTFALLRQNMVAQQLRARNLSDEKVLAAMAKVERERFVPREEKPHSYDDGPLPIGFGQTISQPYIVAYMTEKLELSGKEKVLEIGTGSGYQTAILAEMISSLYTVEIIPELSRRARELLTDELGYANVFFKVGRGQEGWPEFAPFDRMIVTAAAEEFPEALFGQLGEGGLVIAPVGGHYQQLLRFRKLGGRIFREGLLGVAFVPLI